MSDIQRFSVQSIRSEHQVEDTFKNLRLIEKTLLDQDTIISALQVSVAALQTTLQKKSNGNG